MLSGPFSQVQKHPFKKSIESIKNTFFHVFVSIYSSFWVPRAIKKSEKNLCRSSQSDNIRKLDMEHSTHVKKIFKKIMR